MAKPIVQTLISDPRDARIAELEAALAARSLITVRVGKSGTVSVYGLQRFPVSLHPEQWDRLLVPAILAEIGRLCQLSHNDPAAFAKLVAKAAERAAEREGKS